VPKPGLSFLAIVCLGLTVAAARRVADIIVPPRPPAELVVEVPVEVIEPGKAPQHHDLRVALKE